MLLEVGLGSLIILSLFQGKCYFIVNVIIHLQRNTSSIGLRPLTCYFGIFEDDDVTGCLQWTFTNMPAHDVTSDEVKTISRIRVFKPLIFLF